MTKKEEKIIRLLNKLGIMDKILSREGLLTELINRPEHHNNLIKNLEFMCGETYHSNKEVMMNYYNFSGNRIES
tara:strand:+ start:312 stop:533 length:222 start_codon:yes stop_codon:yes gene_type:complete